MDTAERPTYAMGAIMNENLKIDAVLARRKYLVTCGTGGVGKTTLSAAIAIRAALAGKDAVVVTIDPAKRLAPHWDSTLRDSEMPPQISRPFKSRARASPCRGLKRLPKKLPR